MIRQILLAHDEAIAARLVAGRPELRPRLATVLPLARAAGVGVTDALLAQGFVTEEEIAVAARKVPRIGTWRGLQVQGELGRGEHGIVLLAHGADGAPLALKILRILRSAGTPIRADSAERFRRESRLLARLDHPGIARLRDAGEEDGLLYIVSEAAPGAPLSVLGPQPPRDAVGIGYHAARALAHAHAQGIIHRDLRPENVIVGPEGPRLVDFGLAKDLEGEGTATGSHSLMGTIGYAAPEQLVLAGKVDAKADVYGLAAVVHFALLGRAPFTPARTYGELFGRARKGFPGLGPCGLPRSEQAILDAILTEALRADPRERLDVAALESGLAYAYENLRA